MENIYIDFFGHLRADLGQSKTNSKVNSQRSRDLRIKGQHIHGLNKNEFIAERPTHSWAKWLIP